MDAHAPASICFGLYHSEKYWWLLEAADYRRIANQVSDSRKARKRGKCKMNFVLKSEVSQETKLGQIGKQWKIACGGILRSICSWQEDLQSPWLENQLHPELKMKERMELEGLYILFVFACVFFWHFWTYLLYWYWESTNNRPICFRWMLRGFRASNAFHVPCVIWIDLIVLDRCTLLWFAFRRSPLVLSMRSHWVLVRPFRLPLTGSLSTIPTA